MSLQARVIQCFVEPGISPMGSATNLGMLPLVIALVDLMLLDTVVQVTNRNRIMDGAVNSLIYSPPFIIVWVPLNPLSEMDRQRPIQGSVVSFDLCPQLLKVRLSVVTERSIFS